MGRPWATVITAVVCALVAAGALATAASLRDRGEPATGETTPPSTSAADGCAVEPCRVLVSVPVGGNQVQLIVDRGNASGRVRIDGAGSSEIIEVSITERGAVLGPGSLRCVPGTLVSCLVEGKSNQGVIGQVIVGRTGKWGSLTEPYQSDAGYLALVDVTGDTGAEILAAQHRCDRKTEPDCSTTPVYVHVYNLRGEDKGCTRDYRDLESLPGWPVVTLHSSSLSPARCA